MDATALATRDGTHNSTTPTKGYIPGLDGIRAICITLVMVAHYGLGSIVPGGLGVTIFFYLSGFLITTLLLQEHDAHGSISLPNFYSRRFLRLGPELVLLLVFSLTAGWLYSKVSIASVVAALTYTTNYYILIFGAYHNLAAPRWGHLWSLAVEEHFYLSFPILVLILGRRRKLLFTTLALICTLALAWRALIVARGAPFGFLESGTFPYTYVATDCRLDSIAYGCLTAILFQGSQFRLTGLRLPLLFFTGAALIMLISLLVRAPGFRESLRYSLQGIAMIAFFVPLFRSGLGAPILTFLETSILKRMGVLSYGAYLWHLEPVSMFTWLTGLDPQDAPPADKLILMASGFVFAYGMAQLSFMITAPLRCLRARFHRQALSA